MPNKVQIFEDTITTDDSCQKFEATPKIGSIFDNFTPHLLAEIEYD